MELNEKLVLLEEIFEVDSNTLSEETELSNLEYWDSVTALSLVAMLDERFGKNIAGNQIKNLKSIGDILAIME